MQRTKGLDPRFVMTRRSALGELFVPQAAHDVREALTCVSCVLSAAFHVDACMQAVLCVAPDEWSPLFYSFRQCARGAYWLWFHSSTAICTAPQAQRGPVQLIAGCCHFWPPLTCPFPTLPSPSACWLPLGRGGGGVVTCAVLAGVVAIAVLLPSAQGTPLAVVCTMEANYLPVLLNGGAACSDFIVEGQEYQRLVSLGQANVADFHPFGPNGMLMTAHLPASGTFSRPSYPPCWTPHLDPLPLNPLPILSPAHPYPGKLHPCHPLPTHLLPTHLLPTLNFTSASPIEKNLAPYVLLTFLRAAGWEAEGGQCFTFIVILILICVVSTTRPLPPSLHPKVALVCRGWRLESPIATWTAALAHPSGQPSWSTGAFPRNSAQVCTIGLYQVVAASTSLTRHAAPP